MISASSSSSTKMRQYRHQMKKTKVFSGFTNQLKEVLGRLGFSKGSGSLRPLPHWPFLSLLHSQQLKFCLNLSREEVDVAS